MDASGGTTGSRIAEALLANCPFDFDFFQAVRLLSRVFPERRRVGQDSLPADEIVRFHGDRTLGFPASAIHDVTCDEDGLPHMEIAFMGLTGRQSVLPFHYTEYVLERRYRSKDTAAADFFDLFLHRLVSFFYCAWEKHSQAVQYEKQLTGAATEAGLSQYLFDLVGMGTADLRGRSQGLEDQALVYYGGLFAQRPRSSAALEGILRDYFQVPVYVAQFRGRWFELGPDEYTDLEVDALQNRLGEGALAGDAVWQAQAGVQVRVGPLSWSRYRAFLPDPAPGWEKCPGFARGGSALPRLFALTRFFLDYGIDFDVKLILNKAEVPDWVLSDEGLDPPALGLSTWLKTADFQEDAGDVVFAPPPSSAFGRSEPVKAATAAI